MAKSTVTLVRSLLGAALLVAVVQSAEAKQVSLADKARLQAAMFKEISRRLVEGAYLHFDLDAQKITPLFPSKTHPMILSMGKHFVLCTDFKTKAGKSVNVDFYAARRGNNFVIFKTAVGKRQTVQQLMQAGRVKPLS